MCIVLHGRKSKAKNATFHDYLKFVVKMCFEGCIYNTAAVMVSFEPTSYTVTEGEDGTAELRLVRSGDTAGETVVTITLGPGTAIGIANLLSLRKPID